MLHLTHIMKCNLRLLLLTVLVGCTSAVGDGEIRDREWTLTWVEGFSTLPAGVTTPTIRFGSDGRMGGNTGCNIAGAAYTVSGNALDIDAIVSTRRACSESRGNELEAAYMRAIENTRTYRLVDSALELLDGSGRVVARFR